MNFENIQIRDSVDADRVRLRALHLAAFGEAEGAEVSALAIDLLDDPTAAPFLSLVAQEGNEILGHVLFTTVDVLDSPEPLSGRILAPLGVAPAAQGRGIGGDLVRFGLERLREDGVDLVFVLGHVAYYPRFGFRPAGVQGLEAPYPIPEEVADAWMVQELNQGCLERVSGTVRCADVLMRPEHWRE